MTRAELALLTLVAAAAAGTARLFTEIGPAVVAVVAAVIGSVLAALLRRTAMRPVTAACTYLAVGGLVAIWLTIPESTSAGVPGTGTLTEAWRALNDGWAIFGNEVAPVEPTDGLSLTLAGAAWACAGLADWGAFRLRARFEATIPALTLFLVSSALGPDDHRVTAAAAVLVGLVWFLAEHHIEIERSSVLWLGGADGAGRRDLRRTFAGMGAAAVVVALVAAPLVPGVADPALIQWRPDDADDAGRVTISPLVDIRGRLVRQSSTELFTVESPQRTYIRLTALDRFDGQIWSSVSTYQDVTGRLPGRSEAPRVDTFSQTYDIKRLAQLWMPTAFQPVAIDIDPVLPGVRYDRDSATLLTESPTSDFHRYTVDVAVGRYTAADLAGAAFGDLGADAIALPDDFSPELAAEARRITAGANSPYEAMLALQNHLRTFRYSLTAQPGHSDDYLADFVLVTKVGYCEQFAGAFAALARSLGAPARVAVGFTPGELGDDGKYHVRGEHAHAWPEVHFEGLGWVAFEPTPGRGAPGNEAYTGVEESQAAPGDPQRNESPTETIPVPPDDDGPLDTSLDTVPGENDDPGEVASEPAEADRWWVAVLTLVAAVSVLIAAGAVGGAALVARDRRRRRAAATEPPAVIATAWAEVAEATDFAGVGPAAGETPKAFAARVSEPALASGVVVVADAVERSTYSRTEPTKADAERTRQAAESVERRAVGGLGLARRLRWQMVPGWFSRRRDGSGPASSD